MVTQLARNWWAVVLRGVVAILFGVLAFIWPALSLRVLILLFGAYALVDGIFALIAALLNRAVSHRWWVLLEGVISIIAGVVAFVWPGLTALALVYVIAAWALITGIFEILAAIELRKEITNEWFLIVDGILSVLFAVLIALYPGAGALGIIWIIAAYAVIFGILLLVLGFRLRSWHGTMSSGPTATGSAV